MVALTLGKIMIIQCLHVVLYSGVTNGNCDGSKGRGPAGRALLDAGSFTQSLECQQPHVHAATPFRKRRALAMPVPRIFSQCIFVGRCQDTFHVHTRFAQLLTEA
jgi:hypothetical protein